MTARAISDAMDFHKQASTEGAESLIRDLVVQRTTFTRGCNRLDTGVVHRHERDLFGLELTLISFVPEHYR